MAQKSKGTSVYTAIYKKLRGQILRGKLKPGDLLPSESQLCSEFGASRETVRKGLKQLDSEGLIYSRPKVGYFVSTPNSDDLTLHFSSDQDNCTTQYCDIHGLLPDELLQTRLQVPADRKVIEFSQLIRSPEGQTVAYEVKYIPYERAYPSVESEMRFAVLPDLTFSKLNTYEYYTDISVSAVTADEVLAALLGCPVGEPLLLLEQIFIRQDGMRIGFSRRYCRQLYYHLRGMLGHKA